MGERMHLLADALKMMEKSFVLAQIQQAFALHRSKHTTYFWACELMPCSQIEMNLKCYVEAAQEELEASNKLRQARAAVRSLHPHAATDTIEYSANLAVKASPPPDDSNHPIYLLESPNDPGRMLNLKYPGLDFHRGRHRDALPAVASSYYLRFTKTGDPEVLLEFLREHPIEFECSGWVSIAFGQILTGMPRISEGEERARILFRRYWKQIKRPKSAFPTLPQMFVLAIAHGEHKCFSTPQHKQHFRRAVLWLAKQSGSNDTSAAFKRDTGEACSCISQIDFSELRDSVASIKRMGDDADRPVIAHVLQEYVGRICGISSRTLRSWQKRFNLT